MNDRMYASFSWMGEIGKNIHWNQSAEVKMYRNLAIELISVLKDIRKECILLRLPLTV